MNKSLLKMALIAVVVGGLPKLNKPIGGEKVRNKYIPVGCVNFTDYIRRDTILLCGYDALNYVQPKPMQLSIGNGEYMRDVNDKLASISYTPLDEIYVSNNKIDKMHRILVPTAFKNNGPMSDYTVAIFSNTSDTTLYDADSLAITVKVTHTDGEAYCNSFTITDRMHSYAKKYLQEINANAVTHYFEGTKYNTVTAEYHGKSINGYIYPWTIKKHAVYMPIRFDEYSYCTKETCGLEQGSYISKVSYKLLLMDSWSCIQMYKTLDNDKVAYLFDIGNGPMTINELTDYYGYTHGYLNSFL